MMQNVKQFWRLVNERPNAPYSYPYQQVSTTPLAELYPDAERAGRTTDGDDNSPTKDGDDASSITSSKTLATEELIDTNDEFMSPLDWWKERALWALLYTLRCLRVALIYTIPSFIQNLWADNDPSPRKLPPTAYLNGVRGLAAFFVFLQHYTTDYYVGEHHWGYHVRNRDIWISSIPILRLVHCGGLFAVTTFFILSGYVLAYKPLQYIRQRDNVGLIKNMTSAIFRRALRLFLPLLPPLLLAAFLVWCGVYGDFKHMRMAKSVDGKFWSEIWFIIRIYIRLANPFPLNTTHPAFIPALYTIPTEFRGSILVFTMVIGLANVAPIFRITSIAIISLIALWNGSWESFLFMNGVILAELRYVRNDSTTRLQDFVRDPHLLHCVKVFRVVFWIFTLISSLYLGSWPMTGGEKTPGYITLARWSPSVYKGRHQTQLRFWDSIASVLLLYSLENLQCLQKPFATAFMRYLGDISFSLYVIHFPVLLTIGRRITVPMIHWTGSHPLGLIIGGFLITPFLIWASDLQWRAFDLTSVRFAKWLEERFFVENGL